MLRTLLGDEECPACGNWFSDGWCEYPVPHTCPNCGCTWDGSPPEFTVKRVMDRAVRQECERTLTPSEWFELEAAYRKAVRL